MPYVLLYMCTFRKIGKKGGKKKREKSHNDPVVRAVYGRSNNEFFYHRLGLEVTQIHLPTTTVNAN